MSKKARQYSYTKLADLQPNTVVGVYGLVKFIKPAIKSRGTDYRQVISIIDPSLHGHHNKLVCVIFVRDLDKVVPVKLGSIVRFHRLKINLHCGNLQGQSGPGFSWVVCDGENGHQNPKSSSESFTFTDEDVTRVKELYRWSQERVVDVRGPICIEDITLNIFFDLICQVVSTCMIDQSCFSFRVWDGTLKKCAIPDISGEFKGDEVLIRRSQERTVDIAVYDDHLRKAIEQNIASGQFVKLVNVHATNLKQTSNENHQSEEMIQLNLHQGIEFGPSAFPLDETQACVIDLKKRLADIQSEMDRHSSDKGVNTGPLCPSNLNDDEESRTGKQGVSNKGGNSTNREEGMDGIEIYTADGGNNCHMEVDNCMLETVTVVNDHPHVKRTPITDILNHCVPYKFRVLSRVVAYQPCPVSAESLVSLYCPSCHHIMRIDEQTIVKCPPKPSTSRKEMYNRFSDSSSSENSGRVKPKCPRCEEKNGGSENSMNLMNYIFMLRFLLHDGKSWLSANLWKDEAVTFLKDITPEDVISNPKHEAEVKQMLGELCPLDKPLEERPWVDLCLKSYTTPNGTMYQIFDTSIA